MSIDKDISHVLMLPSFVVTWLFPKGTTYPTLPLRCFWSLRRLKKHLLSLLSDFLNFQNFFPRDFSHVVLGSCIINIFLQIYNFLFNCHERVIVFCNYIHTFGHVIGKSFSCHGCYSVYLTFLLKKICKIIIRSFYMDNLKIVIIHKSLPPATGTTFLLVFLYMCCFL